MGHNRAKTPYLGSLADDDYEKRPDHATTHQLLILTESSIPKDENEGFVDVESQKMTTRTISQRNSLDACGRRNKGHEGSNDADFKFES